jgi:hypothetical protein
LTSVVHSFTESDIYHRSSAPHEPNPPPNQIINIKMRFSAIAAAVMATVVAADTTYYSTTVSLARAGFLGSIN